MAKATTRPQAEGLTPAEGAGVAAAFPTQATLRGTDALMDGRDQFQVTRQEDRVRLALQKDRPRFPLLKGRLLGPLPVQKEAAPEPALGAASVGS